MFKLGLEEKIAIITGGSRGVGAATAKLLASKGWNVTITCTSSIEDASNIVKECEERFYVIEKQIVLSLKLMCPLDMDVF